MRLIVLVLSSFAVQSRHMAWEYGGVPSAFVSPLMFKPEYLGKVLPGRISPSCGQRVVVRNVRKSIVHCNSDNGGRSAEKSNLAGMWNIFAGESAEADGERIILRVDGQVAGGPTIRTSSELNVSWASDQKPAGGKWKEYVGFDGKRRLEIALIIPPLGTLGRSAKRHALYYDGFVLEMLEYNSKTEEMDSRSKLRVFGNVTRGELDGDPSLR
jgi:hypothetical protein